MKIFLLFSLISFNVHSSGSLGGAVGSTGEDKVVVQPTKRDDLEEDILYGKNCLSSLDSDFNFTGKIITTEFLKKEITIFLQKPKKSPGRSIASAEEGADVSKPISCKIFARSIDDPRFLDLIVPRETVTPLETPMPVKGTLTR